MLAAVVAAQRDLPLAVVGVDPDVDELTVDDRARGRRSRAARRGAPDRPGGRPRSGSRRAPARRRSAATRRVAARRRSSVVVAIVVPGRHRRRRLGDARRPSSSSSSSRAPGGAVVAAGGGAVGAGVAARRGRSRLGFGVGAAVRRGAAVGCAARRRRGAWARSSASAPLRFGRSRFAPACASRSGVAVGDAVGVATAWRRRGAQLDRRRRARAAGAADERDRERRDGDAAGDGQGVAAHQSLQGWAPGACGRSSAASSGRVGRSVGVEGQAGVDHRRQRAARLRRGRLELREARVELLLGLPRVVRRRDRGVVLERGLAGRGLVEHGARGPRRRRPRSAGRRAPVRARGGTTCPARRGSGPARAPARDRSARRGRRWR